MEISKITDQCIKLFIIMLKPKPKYRIVKTRDKKFLSQAFIGYWKIGFYLNFNYNNSIPLYDIANDTLDDAESAIQRAIEEKKKSKRKRYIIKEYI